MRRRDNRGFIERRIGELFNRILFSIIVFVVMSNAGFGGGYLASMIIGMILEVIVLVLMQNIRGNLFKEILYWGSQLLIVVPMIIMGFEMQGWSDADLDSWILIDAIGFFVLMTIATYFEYGMHGVTAYIVEFGSCWVYLLICWIVGACSDNRALLIFNIAVAFIGLIGAVLVRIFFGERFSGALKRIVEEKGKEMFKWRIKQQEEEWASQNRARENMTYAGSFEYTSGGVRFAKAYIDSAGYSADVYVLPSSLSDYDESRIRDYVREHWHVSSVHIKNY